MTYNRVTEERTRSAEVARLLAEAGAHEEIPVAIAQGLTAAQIRERILLHHPRRPAALGMSASEVRQYSLREAISGLAAGKVQGFEKEIDQELRVRCPPLSVSANSLLVPADVFFPHLPRRDLTVASAGAGGYLIETANAGFIEVARPLSWVMLFGATALEGLTSNVTFPRITTGSGVSALGTESTPATESTPTTAQVVLTPKMLAAYVEFSRKLLLQSNPSVERVLAQDMLGAFAARLDALALQGTGANGEPLGVLNTSGVGSVVGTSLDLTKVLEFQTDVGDRLSASGAYLTTRAVAALLAAREKVATTGQMLWTGNLHKGELGGFPAASTSNMPTAKMLFGAFDQMFVAGWGTLEIEINPYANFQAGVIGARILHPIDVAARDPAAFAKAEAIT